MLQAVIRSVIWTLFNFGAIQVIKYGDSSDWSEWNLALLMIPVGIINCAVCFHSFYGLRKPSKNQLIYSGFGLLNAVYFFITWNELHILSGAMTS